MLGGFTFTQEGILGARILLRTVSSRLSHRTEVSMIARQTFF